jgi:hypothetical protein
MIIKNYILVKKRRNQTHLVVNQRERTKIKTIVVSVGKIEH